MGRSGSGMGLSGQELASFFLGVHIEGRATGPTRTGSPENRYRRQDDKDGVLGAKILRRDDRKGVGVPL